MNNSIYLRRKNKVFFEPGNSKHSVETMASLVKNIESIGFSLSPELILRLQTLDDSAFLSAYLFLTSNAQKLVGANKSYKPMYPNFPQQVMDMSDANLWWNSFFHYSSDGEWMPEYEVEGRTPSTIVLKKPTTISLGSVEEFEKMIKNIIGSGTSISDSDKNDVKEVLTKESISNYLPEQIPFKENLTFVGGIVYNLGLDVSIISSKFNTATDALRLAVAMNDGDVSLSENTKFKKMKRSARKFILSAVESQKNIAEDMLRNKMSWIRLGEILHPGEFSTRFPKTFAAFKTIRNSEKIETFAGNVESAIKESDVRKVVKNLKSRPGEFARRLDQVLRMDSNETDFVLAEFEKVCEKISSPVLLQVIAHFENRFRTRYVFPKGAVAKMQNIGLPVGEIEETVCSKVVSVCNNALIQKFSVKPKLGKVFISDELKEQIVPFSQRSASKAFKTFVRGSKVPLGDGNIVRFFIWWKGNDVDLSAACFDYNWKKVNDIGFYNLKGSYAVHSGDITRAPNGASEFIDIDIEKAISSGVRYVQMGVYSYSGIDYCDMPECFAGFMMRENQTSGEIYNPKEVVNKVDLTAKAQSAIPLIIDLVDRKMIWVDLALNSRTSLNASGKQGQIGQCFSEMKKFNLYDLFVLHGMSRGEIVSNREEADVVFAIDGNVTPFDTDTIVGEYL